jgi:chromosome segregation ATPase
MVGEICHDLEERCTTAEEPFREEEAKNNQLRQEVSDMNERNKELQGHIVERDLLLESLEADKTESDSALNLARSEIEMLFTRVDKLEQELVTTKNAARDEVNRIKAESDSRELEIRASLASKQSNVEELDASLLKSKNFIKSLQSEVASARADIAELQGNYEALDSSLEDFQKKLRTEGRLKEEANRNAEKAEADKNRLINELNNLQTTQKDLIAHFDLRCERNDAETDTLKRELEALMASHMLASKQSLEKVRFV